AISGTGVRNDFTHQDAAIRLQHVQLVKSWIAVAAKLGAPVLRIFSGLEYPPAEDRNMMLDMLTRHINECLPVAKAHGVILAVQNHHDFLRTGDEVKELFHRIQSPWFGLVLDIGSYRGASPFEDIAKTIPYAVNWQIKEKMFVDGKEQATDLAKLYSLIRGSGYRGYLPVETLGPGDPFKKVPAFLKQFRAVMKEGPA
ncbi:MAG: sugar phosphate isomerase/epimerase, partial [Chitinophagaceae bacterium]